MLFKNALNVYRESFAGLSRPVWMLSLVTLVNRSGTMVIPFLTVYLTQELNFTFAQAGYVMSCFGAGALLGSYGGGKLTDRIGHYDVQFWTLLLSGVFFITLQFASSFTSFCLLIFVLSSISEAFRPANAAAIAAYSKPENLTRSYSLRRLAINLGFAAGPAIGGLLAGTLGYDWLFWIDGLTCIFSAFLFRYSLPKKEEENRKEEISVATNTVSPYKDQVFLIFITLVGLSVMAFFQLFSSVPVFFKQDLGIDETQLGLLMGLNGLLIAVLEMPIVYLVEGRIKQLHIITVGTFLVGLSFIVFTIFPPGIFVAIISTLLITFGEILGFPFMSAFVAQRSTPENRGLYMGLYSMAPAAAHIVAPTLGLQWASYYSFNQLWYLIFILCFFVSLGFWFLNHAIEKKKVVAFEPK